MKNSRWSRATAVTGAAGLPTAIPAPTPALGANTSTASGSTVKILSTAHPATVVVANSGKTLVRLKLPAGHWWISGKLPADSVPAISTTHTIIGCAITTGSSPPLLDNTLINIPKTAAHTSP